MGEGEIQIIIRVGEECGLVGGKGIDTGVVDGDLGYAVDGSKDVRSIVIGA